MKASTQQTSSTQHKIEIVSLDQLNDERLRTAYLQCAAIDAERKAQMGLLYSEEAWQQKHFSLDLPGKRELSLVALEEDTVLGFWIASEKHPGWHHTHRVATRTDSARSCSASLGTAALKAAKQRGCTELTLTVNESNTSAIEYYRRQGYRECRDTDLIEIATRLGFTQKQIHKTHIRVQGDYRLIVMYQRIH